MKEKKYITPTRRTSSGVVLLIAFSFILSVLLSGCSGNQEATDTSSQEPDATKATAISYINSGIIGDLINGDGYQKGVFASLPIEKFTGSYEFDKYGCVYIKDDTNNLKIQALFAYPGQGSTNTILSDDGKNILEIGSKPSEVLYKIPLGGKREFNDRLMSTDEFYKVYDEKYKDYKNNLIIPEACKKGTFDKTLLDGIMVGNHTLEGQFPRDLPPLGEPYVKS